MTISIDIFNDKGELVDHSEQRNVRRDDLPLLLAHDAHVAVKKVKIRRDPLNKTSATSAGGASRRGAAVYCNARH